MSNDTAKDRLKMALPTVFAMLREAKETGIPRGGVISTKQDSKAGQVIGTFDLLAMMNDVAEIVQYHSNPKEEDADYFASKILAKFGA